MQKINIQKFKDRAWLSLERMIEEINSLPTIQLKSLEIDKTVLVTVDMINGFAKQGPLYSDRIAGLIPYIKSMNTLFEEYLKIFFADTHSKQSVEFKSYPEHGLPETGESDIIDELSTYLNYENATLIPKNSTNGFLSRAFGEWLNTQSRNSLTQFVILGDCTDICVMQFALTLKAFFNESNIHSRIIIPIRGVETFDLEGTNHDGDLMNLFALYNMKINGIELVTDIE
jgi:nicotinamidase-related amidase